MSVQIDQVLKDRYRIQSILGEGGMGTVYLAQDLLMDRPRAIKELYPDPLAGEAKLLASRQQFRRDIKAGRFSMEFAPSAPAALARAAEIRDPSLILILSDINMPGMSGLEMLPKVRAQRPDVPVIMITAYGDAETRRKAIEQGAVGLLTKPIDFALLRHEIDSRIEQAA